MKNLLHDLTIVIPTKNRPNWLKRIFQYYSEYNFTGKIIITDSSNVETFEDINRIKNIYKNLSINTYNFPNLNCESAINAILDKIETKYSVFLADDDILLIDGLIKGVNFLNNDSTYVAAVGNAYMLGTITNQPFGSVHSIVDYNLKSYDNENDLKRIEDYFNDPRALSVAVISSKVFIECYKSIMHLDKRYQTMIFGENLQAVCYLEKVKIIKLESEYLVRQFHTENLYHKIDYVGWLKNNEFRKAFNFLEKYTESTLKFKKNDQVEKIFKKYFEKIVNKAPEQNNKKILIEILKKYLPIKIIKKIKFYLYDLYKVKKFKKTVELNNYIRIIESKKFNRKLK